MVELPLRRLRSASQQQAAHEVARRESAARSRAVLSVARDFTYELGLLIAGHPVKWDHVADPVIERLTRMAAPFLDAAFAFRPNFGQFGRGAVDAASADGSNTARVRFANVSTREAPPPHIGLIPTDRELELVMTVSPDDDITSVDFVPVHGAIPIATSPQAGSEELANPGDHLAEPEAASDGHDVVGPGGHLAEAALPPRCAYDEHCQGLGVTSRSRCLAHAAHEERLEYLRTADWPIDGRGTVVSPSLFAELLDEWASVPGKVLLLDGARFTEPIDCSRRTIPNHISLSDTVFSGFVDFSFTRFEGLASFANAHFERDALFSATMFRGPALFEFAQFDARADFKETQMLAGAAFNGARFEASGSFSGAAFGDPEETLTSSLLVETASFQGAAFRSMQHFGPVSVLGHLNLDGTRFDANVVVDARAAVISCFGALFENGVQLRARYADLIMDDAVFGAASQIETAPHVTSTFEAMHLLPRYGPSTRARLVSIRRADLTDVLLADLDLRACLFAGAHNIDRLRIEGDDLFHSAPRHPGQARRRIVAEEFLCRTRRARADHRASFAVPRSVEGPEIVLETRYEPDDGNGSAWFPRPPAVRSPDWLIDVGEPTYGQVASIYRALRKGREDNRDEPGSVDFYYGEMEMRRLGADKGTARAPRLIVTMYWLFTGYALRTTRALVTLLAVVALGAVLLQHGGLNGHHAFPTVLIDSAEASTSLFRPSSLGALTQMGRVVQLALRLIGPVLLGFAALSVRGQIRR